MPNLPSELHNLHILPMLLPLLLCSARTLLLLLLEALLLLLLQLCYLLCLCFPHGKRRVEGFQSVCRLLLPLLCPVSLRAAFILY
jgi:hypothetical protein